MEKNSTEFMQQVYDLATGAYNPGSSIVAENAFVENVFSEGSVCAEAYREVYAAGERLCRRLGVQFGDDVDVEAIVDNMMEIQRRSALRCTNTAGILPKAETGSIRYRSVPWLFGGSEGILRNW